MKAITVLGCTSVGLHVRAWTEKFDRAKFLVFLCKL